MTAIISFHRISHYERSVTVQESHPVWQNIEAHALIQASYPALEFPDSHSGSSVVLTYRQVCDRASSLAWEVFNQLPGRIVSASIEPEGDLAYLRLDLPPTHAQNVLLVGSSGCRVRPRSQMRASLLIIIF